MRAKIIVPAAVLGAIVLSFAFYYRFAPAPVPKSSTPPVQATSAAPPEPAAAPRKLWAIAAHATDETPVADPATASVDDGEDPVEARISQLSDLGTSNDPVSLKTILSDLNNQDAQIRKAALDAAVQFGSQDALPALRNQMNWTDDLREKVAIEDAINYLQLPTPDLNSSAPVN